MRTIYLALFVACAIFMSCTDLDETGSPCIAGVSATPTATSISAVLYFDSCITEVSISSATIQLVDWMTNGMMISASIPIGSTSSISYTNRCTRQRGATSFRADYDTSLYVRGVY